MEQSSSNIMLCVRDARKSERIELSQLNDALMEKFRHGKFLSREFFPPTFSIMYFVFMLLIWVEQNIIYFQEYILFACN